MRVISNKTAPKLHPYTMLSTNIYMAPGIFKVVELIGCSQFSIFHLYHQKHIWIDNSEVLGHNHAKKQRAYIIQRCTSALPRLLLDLPECARPLLCSCLSQPQTSNPETRRKRGVGCALAHPQKREIWQNSSVIQKTYLWTLENEVQSRP